MANICVGDIILKPASDNYEGFKKLCDALNELSANGTNSVSLRLLIEYLGIEFDSDLRYLTYITEIDDEKIQLSAELAWDGHYELWDAICSECGLKWAGLFDECGCIGMWKHDPYGWFTEENYVLDLWEEIESLNLEDGYEIFASKEELTEHLNKKSGFTQTYDWWLDRINESDNGKIREIELDD